MPRGGGERSPRGADPAETLRRALNASLPADVRVLAVDDVPDGLHARFRATSKTYRYWIWNGRVASPFARRYAWHIPQPLDVEAMAAAAGAAVGRHDFAAFKGQGSNARTTVRAVYSPSCGKRRRPRRGAAGRPGAVLRGDRGRVPPPHGPRHRRNAGPGRARKAGPRRAGPNYGRARPATPARRPRRRA